VYSIVGDTFRSYEGPMQAVRSFLLSMLILLVMGLVFGIYVMGFRDFFAAVTDLAILRIISVPAAILIADGIITLYFFRGNPRIQAVRIQAAADDFVDWLQLALFPTPFVIGLLWAGLYWLRVSGHVDGAWPPEVDEETLRSAGLLYAAGYFAGKAILLAHVHSAHFNGSGRRLLGPRWVRWLTTKPENRRDNALKEAANEKQRCSVLQSEWAFGGAEKSTSPLVGEVGARSAPAPLGHPWPPGHLGSCPSGEGMAAQPPTASASPSPQPLPHQGGGA
jgi:hypothetical protein